MGMNTSLMMKPIRPMMPKPIAQLEAILMNSKVNGELTFLVGLVALPDEVDRFSVEVDEVSLGLFDKITHYLLAFY